MLPAPARRRVFMHCELFHCCGSARAAILAAKYGRAVAARHACRTWRQPMRHISDAARWTPPFGASLLIALLVVLSACATSAPAPRTAKPTNTPAPLPTATRALTSLPSPTAVINDISQLNLYGASIYTHSAISVHAADGTVRWKVPLTDIGCPLQS